MKTKPFDGVKMHKTKSTDYKVGNKKLSKKLKNIKMFEEFSMNENDKIISDDEADQVISDFFDEETKLSKQLKNMPVNSKTEPILTKLKDKAKELGYLSEPMVFDLLSSDENKYLQSLK